MAENRNLPGPEALPELSDDDVLDDEHLPHLAHQYDSQKFACIRCGSRNLSYGTVVDFGGQKYEKVRFKPRRISMHWLNSLFNLRPNRYLAQLGAVACRDCGAVLLVVDPAELRRAETVRED
jgi:predicted nucleic-acid-binding Zn-ribbon protein